jgi:hypothetical protein
MELLSGRYAAKTRQWRVFSSEGYETYGRMAVSRENRSGGAILG